MTQGQYYLAGRSDAQPVICSVVGDQLQITDEQQNVVHFSREQVNAIETRWATPGNVTA